MELFRGSRVGWLVDEPSIGFTCLTRQQVLILILYYHIIDSFFGLFSNRLNFQEITILKFLILLLKIESIFFKIEHTSLDVLEEHFLGGKKVFILLII